MTKKELAKLSKRLNEISRELDLITVEVKLLDGEMYKCETRIIRNLEDQIDITKEMAGIDTETGLTYAEEQEILEYDRLS